MRRRPKTSHAELQRVYRENVRAVYGFFAYSVERATAEDLTSGTFERVLGAWHRYDPSRGPERAWIMAIARNLLTDHHRRQRHRDALSTDEHPGLLDRLGAAEPYESVLTADELRRWLAALGEREREILALRYAADLPAADIAELTGLTAANVHQILSRSLRKLREVAGGPPSESVTRSA